MVSRSPDPGKVAAAIVCLLMVVVGLLLAFGVIGLSGVIAHVTRDGRNVVGGDVHVAARTLGTILGSCLAGYGALGLLGMRAERTAGRPERNKRRRRVSWARQDLDGLVDATRQGWLSTMLATTPADRPAAERAATELYRRHGLPAPRFVWTGSPMSGALVIGLLSAGAIRKPKTTLGDALDDRRWAVIGHSLRDAVLGWLIEAYGDELGLDSPLRNRLTEPGQQAQPLRWWWDELASSVRFSARLREREPGVRLPRIDHPRFLAPFPGQIPVDWIARLPGWLQEAAHSVPDTEPGPIARHDLLRRTGLVRYAEASTLLDLLVTVTRSCGWWWPYPRVCVFVERPSQLVLEWVDGEPRPHNADGPAIEYRDGLARYAWHGVVVPRKVITGELTGTDWLREENAEVRRVIAERMGYAWLLERCQAMRVATDEWGTLWWLRHPGEEPMMLLDVVNSTAEPDGSFRRYVLRVPPDQTVPRDAIGWTFGLPPGAYGPTAMS